MYRCGKQAKEEKTVVKGKGELTYNNGTLFKLIHDSSHLLEVNSDVMQKTSIAEQR